MNKIRYCPTRAFIEEKLKEEFHNIKIPLIYNDHYGIYPKWADNDNRIFYERNMTEELMRVGKISIPIILGEGIGDGYMYLGSDYYNTPSISTRIRFLKPSLKWNPTWGKINFYFNPRISGRDQDRNIIKEKSYRTFPHINNSFYSPSLLQQIFPKITNEYDPILHPSIIISLHIHYFRVNEMLGISKEARKQLAIYKPRALMIYEWFSDNQIQKVVKEKALEWRRFLEYLITNNK